MRLRSSLSFLGARTFGRARRATDRTLQYRLRARHRTDAAGIRGMPLSDFAILCGVLFRAEGYETTVTRTTVDDGVDLDLRGPDGRRTLAFCRRWSEDLVGRPFLQRVVGDVGTAGAQLGVVVTTSGFTAEALAFAEAHRLRLLDARELERLAAAHLADAP